MSKNARRITFLILFVIIVILTIAVVYATEKQSLDDRAKASQIENETLSYNSIPYVVSEAPISAYIGEEYSYLVRVVDSDTEQEDLVLTLKEAPAWLRIDAQFTILGTPGITDVGDKRVVLEVNDGINKIEEVFFIKVSLNNE